MTEYVVLFRLPLHPESEMAIALAKRGWQPVSESVFFNVLDETRDEVVASIKELCGKSRQIRFGFRTSAFTVVPLKQQANEPRDVKTLS
ncbi:MAG TPA: hypothetical protein VEK08_26560 [Planctomycetota bacterium]|nr:hypothetical protein [Planctomycetota bacterium]